MRRAGLVLGIAGCIGGCTFSYAEYGVMSSQRAQHQNFQRWVSSPIIQHELSALKDAAANKPPAVSNEGKPRIPLSFIPDPPAHRPRDFYTATAAISGSFDGWPVNANGIDHIQFYGSGEIYQIHLDGGSVISDTPPSSDWDYFSLVLAPNWLLSPVGSSQDNHVGCAGLRQSSLTTASEGILKVVLKISKFFARFGF